MRRRSFGFLVFATVALVLIWPYSATAAITKGGTAEEKAARIELLWTHWSWARVVGWDSATLYIWIVDHGRPNPGLAEKACEILRKHGIEKGKTIQLSDDIQSEFFAKTVDFEKLNCDRYFGKK